MEGLAHPTQTEPGAAPPFPSLEIRALNPDNHQDIERIIALYQRCYGSGYPFARVYRPHFWKGQGAPSRAAKFVNLVAVDGQEFVGHLGVKLEPQTGQAEIYSIAVDLSRRQNLFKTGHAAWAALAALAKRQEIYVISHYCPLLHPALQLLSVKCFHSVETAILPAYLTGRDDPPPGILCRSGAILMHRALRPDPGQLRYLYPPPRHSRIIASLYRPLLLRRAFRLNSPGSSEIPPDNTARTRLFRRHAVLQAVLKPSGAPDLARALALLEKQAEQLSAKPYLQIRLDHPSCPSICSLAEYQGFAFCGILPNTEGHDYLLYSRLHGAARNLSLYSKRAKTLWKYIQASRLQ